MQIYDVVVVVANFGLGAYFLYHMARDLQWGIDRWFDRGLVKAVVGQTFQGLAHLIAAFAVILWFPPITILSITFFLVAFGLWGEEHKLSPGYLVVWSLLFVAVAAPLALYVF